jgi:hypothetical protein
MNKLPTSLSILEQRPTPGLKVAKNKTATISEYSHSLREFQASHEGYTNEELHTAISDLMYTRVQLRGNFLDRNDPHRHFTRVFHEDIKEYIAKFRKSYLDWNSLFYYTFVFISFIFNNFFIAPMCFGEVINIPTKRVWLEQHIPTVFGILESISYVASLQPIQWMIRTIPPVTRLTGFVTDNFSLKSTGVQVIDPELHGLVFGLNLLTLIWFIYALTHTVKYVVDLKTTLGFIDMVDTVPLARYTELVLEADVEYLMNLRGTISRSFYNSEDSYDEEDVNILEMAIIFLRNLSPVVKMGPTNAIARCIKFLDEKTSIAPSNQRGIAVLAYDAYISGDGLDVTEPNTN